MKKFKLFALIAVLTTCLFNPYLLFADTVTPKWYDNISLKGDARLRWDGIYKNPGNDNERERYRARLSLSATISENIELFLRFETGIDDPVSSNQTFGESTSGKEIGIGRAYVNWKVNEKLQIMGGKMKMPWFTAGENNLLWDNDLNPEGIFVNYEVDSTFFNGAYIIIDQDLERNDTILQSFQAGKDFKLNNTTSMIAGIGYHGYKKAYGNLPFYKAKGNSLDLDGNYLFDYKLYEFFSEIKTELAQLPVILHLEVINNSAVTDENKAHSWGIKVGSSKKRGDKQFSYTYQNTEKNAVLGSFSDSDFAGGHTDSKGHFIRTRYTLKDNMTLSGAFIVSNYKPSKTERIDYNRVHIDLEFKF